MSSRQRRRRQHRRSAAASGGIALLATLAGAGVADAQTYTVQNTSDGASPGPAGSLREALTQANAHAGADTITFASTVTGSIGLTAGPLSVSDPVTISGPGARALSIDAHHTSSILAIGTNATTSLSGLSLLNADPAAVVANTADLTLDGVAISGTNTASSLAIGVESISGNLTLTRSTISGTTGPSAIGVYAAEPPANHVTVSNTTVTGTIASGVGVSIVGAGLAVAGASPTTPLLTLTGSTVTGNGTADTLAQFSGGVSAGNVPIAIQNSIVTGNTLGGHPDAADNVPFTASFSDLGTVSGTLTDPAPDGATNLRNVDPQLGPLGNHGGQTDTMVPALHSPVVDKGSAFGLTGDQRGLPRPLDTGIPNAAGGDGTDIGAVELSAGEILPAVSALGAHTGRPGARVVITGARLGGATKVLFGTTRATFTRQSATHLTATAPAHATGRVDVTVVTPDGTSPVTSADRFAYLAPLPPVLALKGKAHARKTRTSITITPGASVTCPKGGPTCKVSYVVTTKAKNARHRTVKLTVARKSLSIKAGRKATLSFKLPKRIRTLLAKVKKLKFTVAVTGRAGTSRTVRGSKTVTLTYTVKKTKGR